MKKSAVVLGLAVVLVPMNAFATTVVVHDDDRRVAAEPVAVIQPVGTQTVVVDKQQPVVLQAVTDPRVIEGEIINMDLAAYTMTIRDIDGRERKVVLKRGTINNYKVDDYVVVRLTPDMREAMDIETRHVADLEGDVVQVDPATGRIVIRERNGNTRTVLARADMVRNYKAGDYVRLYVVLDDPNYQEAKIIRVR